MGIDLAGVKAEAEEYLARAPEGPGLSACDSALIAFALAASPSVLDVESMGPLAQRAVRAGADQALLVEVLMLAAAVGVHAVHEGVIALNGAFGAPDPKPAALRVRRQHEGSAGYWSRLDDEVPGFLDGLSSRATWAYEAFIAFAGAPAKFGRLTRLERELVWAGLDATPSHRYVPGLRLHLDNAVRLGATRAQLIETLGLAATGRSHCGVARHLASGNAGRRPA